MEQRLQMDFPQWRSNCIVGTRAELRFGAEIVIIRRLPNIDYWKKFSLSKTRKIIKIEMPPI